MTEEQGHAERFKAHAAAHDQAIVDRHESLFLRFCDWVMKASPPSS